MTSYKKFDTSKSVLITGGAGFIGFHLSKRLLELGAAVIGFDNCNDYYEVSLKESRLAILQEFPRYKFIKGDLADATAVQALFDKSKPDIVVNLGAQAGVRYSIDHPRSYIDSNVIGFFNILEACRHNLVEHLLFASSSSVYGNQEKTPFCTTDNVDETCANIFSSIVKAELKKQDGIEINPFEGRNEVGEPIPPVPIQPVRYADGSIYLPGGEVIKLSAALKPHKDINETKLPYINALCEVYSEQLDKEVTPNATGDLPDKLKRHLEIQRQAYFEAKSVQHSVRDAFVDGERQFDALKDDAFDGIEMVYETGYARLKDVLKKITDTELTKSNLVNIKGLITNQGRKGVCHILVDDERIKSWVNIDA